MVGKIRHTKQLYVNARRWLIEVINTWGDMTNIHQIALEKGDCAKETTREGFKKPQLQKKLQDAAFQRQEEKQKGSFSLCHLKDQKEGCSRPRTIVIQLTTKTCICWEAGSHWFFHRTYTLHLCPGFETDLDPLHGKWSGWCLARDYGDLWISTIRPLSLPLGKFTLAVGYLSGFVFLSLWIVFGHLSYHK